MNGWARAAGIAAAAMSLLASPWAGAFPATPEQGAWSSVSGGRVELAIGTALDRTQPRHRAGLSECECDQIVIDALNELRDAKVETGDAVVRNLNVTYISAAFMATISDEFELDVEQRAEAVTGDATAGQILSALPAAGRCADVLIRAINILEDVLVRSGDAIASNRNFVLLDPGVDRERIDFDIDQDADARSGAAVAGQVIGASGGGDRCGSVTVEATNDLEDVEVETGAATMENVNDIRTCAATGCIAELLEVMKKTRVGAVRMCTEEGCRDVSRAELSAQLEPAPAASAEPPPSSSAPPSGSESEPAGSPAPSDQSESDESSLPGGAVGEPSPSPTPASA